jgi:hypothetical protein
MIPTNLTTQVRQAGDGVRAAIANASAKTGVDFNYLLGQAQIESGMRANAKASTSSATGLYQFIESSWLSVVKDHGAGHGLSWASDAIKRVNGRLTVADPQMKRAILDLRRDPNVAAVMAAEHAADNKAALETKLGRAASGTDLYMAHFLGQGGAASFLSAHSDNPNRTAAALFPSAARANRGVFFAGNGRARTLGEIYDKFAQKLGNGVQLAGNALPGARGKLDTAALNRMELARITGTQEVIQNPAYQAQPGFAEVNVLRPTPANARLAYLMLAGMGN